MAALEEYSSEEFNAVLAQIITDRLGSGGITSSIAPCAVLLGGQSGAGKTTLHPIFRKKFGGNVIVINGDEYRSFHPRYRELDQQYGPEAVAYTAPWAGKMTEALIDELSRRGYNLIIEGTLRTYDVPMKTATLLKERGYNVSLALMAVKPEISLVSCLIRYESMRIAGTIPRATDPAHHQKIIQEIVGNLQHLESTGVFDAVRLFSRAKQCLYPVKDDARMASEALRDVLFGEWTPEEMHHYENLQKQLEELKTQQSFRLP
ncbi:MAG: zeta toxin family protein [Eggerthellaceae bacterium]